MSKKFTGVNGRAVSLRPVSPEDENFLSELYATTRSEEMKLVPWSEAQKAAFLKSQFQAQLGHYRDHFPDAQHQIITLDCRPVGRLQLHRRAHEIRILEIALLPQYRGTGIGTPLIKQVMEEGARERKPVTIYVDSRSPARDLFQRLEFSTVEDNGINALMKWQPPVNS
jgi:GNAT superfamily N-acetyltransferase